MSEQNIRVVALAIIRQPMTGRLLVFEGRDPSRSLVYHRPLGGGVEFGETAAIAVRREMREEVGIEVEALHVLGVSEAMFAVGGDPRHEVALLVECRFVDEWLYLRDVFEDIEGKGEHGFWRKIDDLTPLFPEALNAILGVET